MAIREGQVAHRRMTAAMRNPDGSLHAAATPRLMQAYAVGR